MKKTIFLAALLFTIQLADAQEATKDKAAAQSGTQINDDRKGNHKGSPEQKAEKFVTKMHAAIGLEEAQKNKVRSLAIDHFRTMEEVKKQANGDQEKMKLESKKSRKIFNEGLKKVLTASQFEAWKVKRKEESKKQTPNAEPVDNIEDEK